MRAGLIEKRITLEVQTTSGRTDRGAPKTKWKIVDTVFADVRFGSDGAGGGSETEQADRVVGIQQATFTIRFRDDIRQDTKTRVRYDGKVYNISSVAPGLGRRDRMVLIGDAENV